ncbi:MAG: hypothetical protein IJC78_06805 [Clostridia bacterium]|nr:hypothetical protein [Clostridia bacterium]
MVTNYYNASNGFSRPVRREPKPYHAPQEEKPCEQCEKHKEAEVLALSKTEPEHGIKKTDFDRDTLLLLGLLLFLLTTGCDDKLLLLALLYLLVF